MTSSTSLNRQLQWLTIQKKVLPFLPVNNNRKKEISLRNKLKGNKLRSLLQEQLIHDLFGSNAYGVVYNSYNGKMVSSIKDVQVNRELGSGNFNQNEIEILKSIIPADSCLYVIGTHIGTLLVPIGKNVRKVIGFEANPTTYQFLLNNININDLSNAQVFNYAICDKESSLKFYSSTANSGGSKIKPQTDTFMYNYDNPDVLEIEGDSLDMLKNRYSLEAPDCIIMDIEGSEYLAIKGAPDCLRSAKLLYIEFVPHHLDNVAGISLEDFINVLTPFFSSMQIMHELIDGKNTKYTGENMYIEMKKLYSEGKSADLLFYK